MINNSELQGSSKLTTNDNTEIKSLAYYEEKNMLLAGFHSGNLGTWELSTSNTFIFKSLDKIHEDVLHLFLIRQLTN